MPQVRLASALGALSFATDLAAGQPQGTAIASAALGVRLGRRLGLDNAALADVYYAALLRRIGCTSTASMVAPMALGDEQAAYLALDLADLSDPASVRKNLDARLPQADSSARAAAIERISAGGTSLYAIAEEHCVQAVMLTQRLPVPDGVQNLLTQIDARWDGWNPTRLAGEAIPVGTRLMEFAVTVEIFRRALGLNAAVEVAAERAGSQFDPEIAALYPREAQNLADDLGASGAWGVFLSSEPNGVVAVGAHDLRNLAFAFADFADQKSRYFVGHSRRVGALGLSAAIEDGLDGDRAQKIFDAGLVHDIGRAAVPTGIWDRPGVLDPLERIEAESGSFHTARVLAIGDVFAGIAECASSVHERCDGSGTHRGVRLSNREACLLATANLYDELTHDTAARPAVSVEAAADLLRREAVEGRLPAACVSAVLKAAGHRTKASPALPAGLTRREAEVLVRIAHGDSGKEAAAALGIAPKTVEKHTENIFRKIGVTSRTAAALFAMSNGLLDR